MAKKKTAETKTVTVAGKPSAILDTRVIYCGDNLEQLKKLPDNCIDLIYIDPPFKSDQNYNVLFQEQNGSRSAAQIHAFEDTWHWDQAAEQFKLLTHSQCNMAVLQKTAFHCLAIT